MKLKNSLLEKNGFRISIFTDPPCPRCWVSYNHHFENNARYLFLLLEGEMWVSTFRAEENMKEDDQFVKPVDDRRAVLQTVAEQVGMDWKKCKCGNYVLEGFEELHQCKQLRLKSLNEIR